MFERGNGSVAVKAISAESTAFAGTDHEFVVTVAVEVAPGHSGAKLAQEPTEQRLSGKILKHFLVVRVIEPVREVLEPRVRGDGRGRGREPPDWRRVQRLRRCDWV